MSRSTLVSQFFLLQHCRGLPPLPAGLHYFCLQIHCCLIFVCMYVIFPQAAFVIFSLSLVLIHLIRKCIFLYISYIWGSLRCLYLCIYSFHQIQNFDHYSFKYIFCSPLLLTRSMLDVFPLLTDTLLIYSFFLLCISFYVAPITVFKFTIFFFFLLLISPVFCLSGHCIFHLQKFSLDFFYLQSLPSSAFTHLEAFLHQNSQ